MLSHASEQKYCFSRNNDVTHQVELLLEFFICIVYTKLFKAVDFKRFKPFENKKEVNK